MAETINDVSHRRRGRPSGKNRMPLSLQERRSRNANYERLRRQETSEAMADLAEAAGCDSNMSNSEILATVLTQLQSTQQSSNMVDDMRIMNEKLMLQIEILEQRLIDEEENLRRRKCSERVKSLHYGSSANHTTETFPSEPIDFPTNIQEDL